MSDEFDVEDEGADFFGGSSAFDSEPVDGAGGDDVYAVFDDEVGEVGAVVFVGE